MTPICGRTIFISPDPSVFNNNNSFKGEEILKELYNFGEGFLERWSSSASSYQLEEDYDSIFMSLNGKSIVTLCILMDFAIHIDKHGSAVVECLTRYQGAAGSGLTRVTGSCP